MAGGRVIIVAVAAVAAVVSVAAGAAGGSVEAGAADVSVEAGAAGESVAAGAAGVSASRCKSSNSSRLSSVVVLAAIQLCKAAYRTVDGCRGSRWSSSTSLGSHTRGQRTHQQFRPLVYSLISVSLTSSVQLSTSPGSLHNERGDVRAIKARRAE